LLNEPSVTIRRVLPLSSLMVTRMRWPDMVLPMSLLPLWPEAEEEAEDLLDLLDLDFALDFFSGSTLVTVALAGIDAAAEADWLALALAVPDWVADALVAPVWSLNGLAVLALAPTSGVAVLAVVLVVVLPVCAARVASLGQAPLPVVPAVPLVPLVVAAVPPFISLVLLSSKRFDLQAAREAANKTANNRLLRGLFMMAP
jgi:hypothetical protein